MASETNAVTETLRTLHRIHIQLTDLGSRLRRGPNLIRAHQNNVDRCQEQLDSAREESKKARLACDAKQQQLAVTEERVKKLTADKKELNASLIRMNDIILKLKQHIADFDEGIKSSI